MTLTSGSLFAGYGGLAMAVEQALGAELAWLSEFEPPTEKNKKPSQGAARILAHRYPDVPNLGDVTVVDWSTVTPVDVIEGGSPCQDVSAAGKRAGMRAGTRSGLWASMCDSIDIIRPRLVVWENVRGALSAGADSDLELCPICVGDERECHLRALGRVVGDLSELGYDTAWCGLRAADVGAPHGRYRVFVLGWPTGDARPGGRSGSHASDPCRGGLERAWAGGNEPPVAKPVGDGRSPADTDGSPRRPFEPGSITSGPPQGVMRETRRRAGRDSGPRPAPDADGHAVREQPEPITGCGGAPVSGLVGTDPVSYAASNGRDERRPEPEGQLRGSDAALSGDALADTERGGRDRGPRDQIGEAGGRTPAAGSGPGDRRDFTAPNPDSCRLGADQRDLRQGQSDVAWGDYAPAIARWESILGRSAPVPTELSARGSQRLSPVFVEFLMGLPHGWVTDVPDLSRNDMLKALGNGVVPAQGAAAIRHLLQFVPASVLASLSIKQAA